MLPQGLRSWLAMLAVCESVYRPGQEGTLFFASLWSLFDLGYAEGAIRRNTIPFHDTADFFADDFLHIRCSWQYAANACVKSEGGVYQDAGIAARAQDSLKKTNLQHQCCDISWLMCWDASLWCVAAKLSWWPWSSSWLPRKFDVLYVCIYIYTIYVCIYINVYIYSHGYLYTLFRVCY